MRFFHRFCLWLGTIVFLFLTFIIGSYGFGWLPQSYLVNFVTSIYHNLNVGFLMLFFFLFGIWLLQSFIVENRSEQTIIQENEMGQVRIALSAVKGMVDQIVLDQPGVTEVKSRYKVRGQAFKIFLKMGVTSETHIPTLTTQVAKVVKERLLKMAGLEVEDVVVTIEEVESEKKRSSSSVRVR